VDPSTGTADPLWRFIFRHLTLPSGKDNGNLLPFQDAQPYRLQMINQSTTDQLSETLTLMTKSELRMTKKLRSPNDE